MTVRAGGVVNFNNEDISLKEKVKIAFKMNQIANLNQIGILLEINAIFGFNRTDINKKKSLIFDLTDDPIDNSSEVLFSGDGIKIIYGNTRVDLGESLTLRMSKVQRFLIKVSNINEVKNIVLFISEDGGQEYDSTLDINVNDFSNKIIELYKSNFNTTPNVRCIITA